MTKTIRKNHMGNAKDISRTEINELIKQGRITRKGSWYQINDMKVLSSDFFGLVKRLFVNKKELLVKLYS